MKRVVTGALVALSFGLSACSQGPDKPQPVGPVQARADISSTLDITAVRVDVPETLKVSEANGYYPSGDIVWREDPAGDRYAQVKAIFEDGLGRGVAGFKGERPAVLDIRVERFHALTEKARYTIGGVHSIRFAMIVRDAETDIILIGPKRVEADLDALGGEEAIAAEAKGITQKVRITEHLSQVIATELTQPEGYKNRSYGLIQAINKF